MLLFGGGLTLSGTMGASGANRFVAGAPTDALQGAPTAALLLGVVTFVVFLTELVSDTASAAQLVPIFLGLAVPLGLPSSLLAAAIAAWRAAPSCCRWPHRRTPSSMPQSRCRRPP